jgi:hypothetical protein
MNKDLSRSSEQGSSPKKVPECGSICINMFKHCSGHCTKKRGHVSPHRCGSCRYIWELSMAEQSRMPKLSGRELPH